MRAFWKSHGALRCVTAFQFVFVITTMIYFYATPKPINGKFFQVGEAVSPYCINGKSGLFSVETDLYLDKRMFYFLGAGHFLAIFSCFIDEIQWLGILGYSIMLFFTVSLTIGQGMSGYIDSCFPLFVMFWVVHTGMAIGLFLLHILFIHTHRGFTFYQWIPHKFGQLKWIWSGRTLQVDHVHQRLPGTKMMPQKRKQGPIIDRPRQLYNDAEPLVEKTAEA